MARNLVLTKYTYQSFNEIIKDLKQWQKNINTSLKKINSES